MKAQLQYKKSDGTEGVALMPTAITSIEEAKRELAATLDLPQVQTEGGDDVDARLRQANIVPDSIVIHQLSE